jgi:hypothetical protein
VWFPNQKLDEAPAMTPAVLLSSSFAQEQYITMAAHQLVSMPGTYMLQVRTAPMAICGHVRCVRTVTGCEVGHHAQVVGLAAGQLPCSVLLHS